MEAVSVTDAGREAGYVASQNVVAGTGCDGRVVDAWYFFSA
jgi:hypothetical protein